MLICYLYKINFFKGTDDVETIEIDDVENIDIKCPFVLIKSFLDERRLSLVRDIVKDIM